MPSFIYPYQTCYPAFSWHHYLICSFSFSFLFELCYIYIRLNGSSSVSETYGNPCLAHSQDFEVKEVEVDAPKYLSLYLSHTHLNEVFTQIEYVTSQTLVQPCSCGGLYMVPSMRKYWHWAEQRHLASVDGDSAYFIWCDINVFQNCNNL